MEIDKVDFNQSAERLLLDATRKEVERAINQARYLRHKDFIEKRKKAINEIEELLNV